HRMAARRLQAGLISLSRLVTCARFCVCTLLQKAKQHDDSRCVRAAALIWTAKIGYCRACFSQQGTARIESNQNQNYSDQLRFLHTHVMDLVARISRHFQDSAQAKLTAADMLAAPIAAAVELMVSSLHANGKIMACGNGGSAADAQHFAAELLNR